jgi:hypothetical protein
MDIKHKFLSGILGKDGAQALKKAVQRDSRLDSVILPRAIIGWLNFISRYEYEGELPGVENSYIEFTKNEDGSFTGSLAIGEDVHEFERADIYHMASAISVSVNDEAPEIDSDLRDLVLVRLGKSIDALAKAHEISRTLAKSLESEDLTKMISMIPKGAAGAEGHDYSHVLKPEHQQAGYSMRVVNHGKALDGSDKLETELHHNGQQVGSLEAYHHPAKGVLEPEVANMVDEHKGKGLGQSMYEAMFAHGYHSGVRSIQGGVHSTDANRVHAKLAGKHGLEGYNPKPRQSTKPVGQFDQRFGNYNYTLKQEEPMDKGIDLPGKTAAPIAQQGPQAPTPPIAKQPKLPRPSTATFKAPSLKIGKTESSKQCSVCEGHQFTNNRFTGCICFRDLAKSIKTTAYSDGYALDFKTDFDKEAYLVLSKYFRG